MLNNAVTTVNEGLCNGFYQELVNANTINSNIASSTAALQSTLCQGFNGINTNMMNGNFATQTAINGIGSQLAQCCCDVRQQISDCCCGIERGQDQINYNLAMNTNNIQNTLCNNTRDIIQSQTDGTRAILDAITANRIEDKNAQIQEQQNEINALRLAASQQAQNAYLVDQLGQKCPQPSYLVCNPNGPLNYSVNSGCGCGCGSY